jgi:hypothetical protein
MVAWRGTTLYLVTGESTRTPWRSADQVGFEPDGTPVLVAADIDGSAVLSSGTGTSVWPALLWSMSTSPPAVTWV